MTETIVLQGVDKEQKIYKEITPGGYGIAIKTKDISKIKFILLYYKKIFFVEN